MNSTEACALQAFDTNGDAIFSKTGVAGDDFDAQLVEVLHATLLRRMTADAPGAARGSAENADPQALVPSSPLAKAVQKLRRDRAALARPELPDADGREL